VTEEKSRDVLGIAPYGEAVRAVAQGAVDGAGAFLGRICLPAAEEFGLYLRDRVATWRRNHAVVIAQRAETLLGDEGGHLHAHPRLVMRIIEDGSWSDDDIVQAMWAGLLASSCCADGRDESNLLFINLLGQLTSSQVRILRFACETATKHLTPAGWLEADREICVLGKIIEVSGVEDIHRLDRELDHLRTVGLLTINAGFMSRGQERIADISPSALALHLYARSQGFRGSLEEFFGLGHKPA
jgi:hypothetical protein